MRIGWDFDEPIFKWFDAAHNACLDAGLADPEMPYPTKWAPYEEYGCTKEEWVAVIDRQVMRGSRGFYGSPIDPEAVALLKRLDSLGYENHIVTARGQFGTLGPVIKTLTREQVYRAGIPHESLTFTKEKGEVAAYLGLDYFIDDSLPNFWDVLGAGVDTFLLDCPWNRDDEIVVPEGRRLASAEEYVNLIIDRHGDVRG